MAQKNGRPKARRIRTEAELRAAAVHVTYEINLMALCAVQVGKASFSSPELQSEEWERCIPLEAFLLHFRNLRAFFCPSLQSLRDDDIIASDFLRKITEEDIGDKAVLDIDGSRLDRMLAHLSYSRDDYISTGRSLWPVRAMAAVVFAEFKSFLVRFPAETRAMFSAIEDCKFD